MATAFYVDTMPDGQYAWVRHNRSRRNHNRRLSHHHDHPIEYIQVPAFQWEALLERERALQEANEAFARESESLKCKLRDSQSETVRVASQNTQLSKDNAKLRKDYTDAVELANKHYNDGKQLRVRIDKLKADNEELEAEVRRLKLDIEKAKDKKCEHHEHHHGLRHKLEELKQAVESWKRRWEDSDQVAEENKRKVARLENIIKDQDDTIETYEKIMRRHGLLY